MHRGVPQLLRLVVEHRVPVRGKRVILKPNLVEFSSSAPINTNPLFVAAAYEAFRALGAAQVLVAEGPGHRRITLELAEDAGFAQAVAADQDEEIEMSADKSQDHFLELEVRRQAYARWRRF